VKWDDPDDFQGGCQSLAPLSFPITSMPIFKPPLPYTTLADAMSMDE
jgi:hypothetical protein